MKHVLKMSFFALIAAVSLNAQAATHEIKMLNMGKDGMMVFEPSYLKANKGDTIKFIPKDPSHEVASVTIPKGGKAFKGAVDKPVTTTVGADGVYFYVCNAHVAMAMVGVIQVGTPSNLEEVKKSAKEVSAKFVTNKDRLDKILAQVK